jgi:hypothetical protein
MHTTITEKGLNGDCNIHVVADGETWLGEGKKTVLGAAHPKNPVARQSQVAAGVQTLLPFMRSRKRSTISLTRRNMINETPITTDQRKETIMITTRLDGIASIEHASTDQRFAKVGAKAYEIPAEQAWFAGGERLGYDPKTRALVSEPSAPLGVFLRREGDLTHAVSFLPGFPDG